MTHKLPLYLENLKVLLFTTMELWDIGGLYFSAVRRGDMMIGLRERWNCQLHVEHQKFFPNILSHRGTCTLYEYVRYWNIRPCIILQFYPVDLGTVLVVHRLEPFCILSGSNGNSNLTKVLQGIPLYTHFNCQLKITHYFGWRTSSYMKSFSTIFSHFQNFFVEVSLLSWQECLHQWYRNHLFRITCTFLYTINCENLGKYIWCSSITLIPASTFCSTSESGSSTQDDWGDGLESCRRNCTLSNVFLYLSGIWEQEGPLLTNSLHGSHKRWLQG